MSKKYIFSHFFTVRNAFSSEISIGIPANAFLLLSFFLRHRPKPIDLTIGHLAFIHLVMLIIIRIIATDDFESQNLWDDITCKAVIYSYQVMRGLSLCTTCQLSVLQAITLSPWSSRLAKFKQTSSHHILCGFFFLWVFNLSMSARFLNSIVATTHCMSWSHMFVTNSCCLWPLNYLPRHTFSMLGIFRDIIFTGLMAFLSAYMVTLLCRHKRQSQHLHSTSLSPRASPELRATRTILLLMGVFVLMYVMDCTLYTFSGMWRTTDPVRLCVQVMVGNGYATIAPLVLISSEKQIITFFKTM
ncbi:vomeronasal type-1 receptor 90-like [Ochotona curzoniae]|uniref:vomeronasal type-1 receptor 90-like n=1 Tax=Ochotona curzoniae TaxID=130825 RepID=UPI001B354368|nr:vomeronasal type-1 receptor 90-like [Ochotona curzoniae]